MCPVVEAFRTDSSYFLHSRIAFDVKQSWERVPLPYLNGEYSKISWFFFIFSVLCSRKQRFLSLFVCRGVKNSVSKSVVFRLALETAFLITFCLLGDWKRCFLLPVGSFGKRNTVSENIVH